MTSTEAFWSVLAVYTSETLPVQIILIVAALISTYFVFAKPGDRSDNLMKAFLSFAFAWNGIVCFLLYCGKNPIALYLGAPLFVVISVLFAVDLFFTKKIKFKLPDVKWQEYLTIVFLFLVFMYPVIGLGLSHIFPGHGYALPMLPCPLAAFTLVLLAAAIPNVDRVIYILVFVWVLRNLPKTILGQFACYEDYILLGIGVYSLIILIINWRLIKKTGEIK